MIDSNSLKVLKYIKRKNVVSIDDVSTFLKSNDKANDILRSLQKDGYVQCMTESFTPEPTGIINKFNLTVNFSNKFKILDGIKVNKERPFEAKKHWLSGMIKCASCGSSLNYNGVTPKRKNACFRCGGYSKGTCNDMNFITVLQAEKLVIDYLYNAFNNVDILYEASIKNTSNKTIEINLLNTELKSLEKKLERAKSGFLNGVFELEV